MIANEPDYQKLGEACDIFYKWAYRGRISGQIKEKYGTIRWYAYLNSKFSLNDIFYPCHMYYRFPLWVRKIDDFVFTYFINPLFGKLIYKYRVYCYRQGYLECVAKLGPLPHSMDHDDLFTEEELKMISTVRWGK